MKRNKALFTSQDQNWITPAAFYRELNKEFHFDYDPCPADPDPEFDGLKVDWGKRNFVNPPYRETRAWVQKALLESLKNKLVVLLIAARTDTRAFHDHILPFAKEIRFIRGRLKFSGHKNSAPFPSMIVVFPPREIKNVKALEVLKNLLKLKEHWTVKNGKI